MLLTTGRDMHREKPMVQITYNRGVNSGDNIDNSFQEKWQHFVEGQKAEHQRQKEGHNRLYEQEKNIGQRQTCDCSKMGRGVIKTKTGTEVRPVLRPRLVKSGGTNGQLGCGPWSMCIDFPGRTRGLGERGRRKVTRTSDITPVPSTSRTDMAQRTVTLVVRTCISSRIAFGGRLHAVRRRRSRSRGRRLQVEINFSAVEGVSDVRIIRLRQTLLFNMIYSTKRPNTGPFRIPDYIQQSRVVKRYASQDQALL